MPSAFTRDEIERAIPEVSDLGEPQDYGQKTVVPCVIDGRPYALKLMVVRTDETGEAEEEDQEDALEEITARAKREVEILRECDCPHLAKLGPLPLSHAVIGDHNVLYFTEEWIEGSDLHTTIGDSGALAIEEVVILATQITLAISCLWEMEKIHRDVKPRNIMRRSAGEFVLLDMGIAFDLKDRSLTRPVGAIPGTLLYFSPEQTEFTGKRQMDFRSDLFSLGIVLYEAATGHHPFWHSGMTGSETVGRILDAAPARLSDHRPDIPARLEAVILRLLAKKPHLRYRSCEHLIAALSDL